MARALTHIGLFVSDVEASTKFYQDWCGMKVVHSRSTESGQDVRWIASPGYEDDFVIVLAPGRENPVEQGVDDITHLGIAVDDMKELKELLERGRKAGIVHWEYQEHKDPVGTLFSVKDPDGYIIEFSVGQPLGKNFKKSGPSGPEMK